MGASEVKIHASITKVLQKAMFPSFMQREMFNDSYSIILEETVFPMGIKLYTDKTWKPMASFKTFCYEEFHFEFP